MNEKFVLGIDGGGTSTRAVLAKTNGEVLGYGRGGSSNYDDIGIEATQENICLAVDQAWENYGHSSQPANAIFLGMAGVVSKSDRSVIEGIATSAKLSDPNFIGIDHDIRIALAGGLALQPGIVLIAGTGSSCYGRNASGRSCRVGGWGYLLDDEGSSYYLGLEAIRAVVRSADGRLDSTALSEPVMAALGLDDYQEIMHRVYHPPMSRTKIAGLAPLVLETAQQGDEIARKIIQNGQNELAQLVEVAAQRLAPHPDELLVTVTGGLAHSGNYFKQGLYEVIRSHVPSATIQEPLLHPVIGAVLLAIELLGETPSPKTILNFEQSELEIK